MARYRAEQLTKATEILQELRKNVTTQDRKDAVKDFDLSDVTISNYLNGHARNLDTAERLIVFFRNRVNRRNELLTTTHQ